MISRSDSSADVGLKHPGATYGTDAGRPLLNSQDRLIAREAVLHAGGVKLGSADALLPIVRLRVNSQQALTKLRRLPQISYIEPNSFVDTPRTHLWNQLGCSPGPYFGPANSTVAPGDILPWNYIYMNIDRAWTHATGANVTVGLVDTGIDSFSPELTTNFASGMSTNRSHVTSWTSAAPQNPYWHDNCGHGTRMAGVIAAPRNGQNIVGVAWKANLYSVRVDNDVLLNQVEATRLGIREAATNSRVVAMAFGTWPFIYSSIVDELAYWYYNHDKLFIAAAGTTFDCPNPSNDVVIFPANQNSIVTAVTRLDPNGTVGCEASRGPDVDFAAYGNQPTTGFLGSVAGFSGSSNATAIIAAVTALMWSRNPYRTRSSILSSLAYAASPTGYLSSEIGWGVPNVQCAVGALCRSWIDGTGLIEQTNTYTFTAGQAQSVGPFSYQWSSGETTQSIQRYVPVTYSTVDHVISMSVTITDLSDGTQTVATKSVMVRQPTPGCPTCY